MQITLRVLHDKLLAASLRLNIALIRRKITKRVLNEVADELDRVSISLRTLIK